MKLSSLILNGINYQLQADEKPEEAIKKMIIQGVHLPIPIIKTILRYAIEDTKIECKQKVKGHRHERLIKFKIDQIQPEE